MLYQKSNPYYINFGIAICKTLSHLYATVHYYLFTIHLTKAPIYLIDKVATKYKFLYNIWLTRFVRRMLSAFVRSPIRIGSLKIVDFNVSFPTETGCLIVICHTPWKRLLVQWNKQNNFSHIISSINLTSNNKFIQSKGEGIINLRNIINLLHQKCRVVIAADVFNQQNNCPVQFMGFNQNASVFPARLAITANVPLIIALPIYSNNKIRFITGPRFNFNSKESNYVYITQKIVAFVDQEIKKHPEIWPSYVY